MKLPFGQNKFIRIFDILCRERERMIFFSANLFTTLVSACERTIKNRAIQHSHQQNRNQQQHQKNI